MTDRQYDNVALEEIKLLQVVITKHDDLRSTVVNWGISLVTALCAVYLSDKSGLSAVSFGALGVAIATLFFWLDVIYKVAQDRAISRSEDIEMQIREGKQYDGPLIGASLAPPNSIYAQLAAANNVRVWFPFLILLIVVIVAACSHN